MIKPKRSAEQQVADEADRRALSPLTSRQTISDSQAEPEFQANHKRLRADRLAREAAPVRFFDFRAWVPARFATAPRGRADALT